MPSLKRKELKTSYSALLNEYPNFILTRYTGLDVAHMTELRRKLNKEEVSYKVVKNNIFLLSLKDQGTIENFPDTLDNPLAVAFVKDNLPSVAKVLKDYGKENEKLQIVAGVMENQFYEGKEVEAMASLPTKEESLAKLAGALNGPATQIAGLMNQIMSSLARAVKAVGEKNG